MYLIQFLLPRYDNLKRPFPSAEFEKVRTELIERFGGVTAHHSICTATARTTITSCRKRRSSSAR